MCVRENFPLKMIGGVDRLGIMEKLKFSHNVMIRL